MKIRPIWRRSLAVVLTAALIGTQAALASVALGHDILGSTVPLAQGTELTRQRFWSDSYQDLRSERYLTYAPNEDVKPVVVYGDQVLSRNTLTGMARKLEAEGQRVVGGINGDYYVFATGAPVGMVISEGVVRSVPAGSGAWYYGVGFREDGSAFIGTPKLMVQASFQRKTWDVNGGINKIRTDGGGITVLTDEFASTTRNTSPGVDVILTPLDHWDGDKVLLENGDTLVQVSELAVGGRMTCLVDKVVESTGAMDIPEGKVVLTMNAKGDPALLAALRALTPGEMVDIDITSYDTRWAEAVNGIGAPSKLLSDGQLDPSFRGDSNAKSRTARTALGIRPDGSVLLYTVDGGKAGHSIGATLEQVALRLQELGCTEAVALDGGGSTTLGSSYPGGDMEVRNRPADGVERANSTAIFLTTTVPATGDLDHFMVFPQEEVLLSGAELQLTSAAVDTNYHPMDRDGRFYLESGSGELTRDGLFTAGAETGPVEVEVRGGGATGRGTLMVVSDPDSIAVADESTGKAVKRLDLDPGAQVDLTASALWQKLPLVSQDTCYTWTCDPKLGTIDENGLFTVAEKSASGSITVTAGSKTVTIPVSVAGHVQTLEDFEGEVPALAPDGGITAGVETNAAYVRMGRRSLRLAYETKDGAAKLDTGLPIEKGEGYLGLWVYGDQSGSTLSAGFCDWLGNRTDVVLTTLDFTGWRHVLAPIPEGGESLDRLAVTAKAPGEARGTLWVDQLTTSNEPLVDMTGPAIDLKRDGNSVTAVVTDNMDKTLPGENVTLSVDGRAVEKRWDEAAGKLTAAVKLDDGRAHRLTVTAMDASGNLTRASADVKAAPGQGNVFVDMAGHWAEPYADYLYETGVTSGAGSTEEGLTYAPDRRITRGEFFALVARWMEVDLDGYADVDLPFADKDSIPAWAYREIQAMYSLGIVSGAGSAEGPLVNAGADISRAEVMAILGRTQPRGYACPELTAEDAGEVPAWALDHVRSLVGQGVVSGYGGHLNPNASITRAEVATLLYTMH